MSVIVIDPPSTGFEGEIATVDSEACTHPLSSAFTDIGITETISIARTIPVKTDLAIVTRGQG